ncbi:MAG: hypothetical protein IPL09_09135 [Bacteroidetes bacterium]|jgi:hypothetical protein|nr:hypothetical protein [Bacteroidota bacterium]HMT34262.1 hypothetical protein [Chitinophagaceae bacterium]MBK6820605.1 hypothetical protein [Bacteroidota bacterium]MBK7040889.1 hypothetical protein [Bacteroidota bacterium]MBK7589244.1 hypothetical protein [Bacteroidota bacterium]
MDNYGIGGNEVKSDASEAFADIPQNRTLMMEKLTKDTPVKPQITHGLQTIEQVFENYKPEVEVEFTDANGSPIKEQLKFANLGDFGVKGITEQSNYLKDITTQKDQYQKIVKQLKTNKILKTALENPEAKQAMIDSIHALIQELNNNK